MFVYLNLSNFEWILFISISQKYRFILDHLLLLVLLRLFDILQIKTESILYGNDNNINIAYIVF